MKLLQSFKDPYSVTLFLIMVFATVLRFYGLTNQSLWLDELHTMRETDPAIPLSETFFYLRGIDPHPPLFFLLERVLFYFFGHTEAVARSLPALCGVLSVWAMYLLGKELLDKKLGVIAALLTSINFFNIEYSQEARGYIVAMLFVAFSYFFFIRLIKTLLLKTACLYGLFTVCMLYSHYYSLFILFAQGLVVMLLLAFQAKKRKKIISTFAVAGSIILLCYLPWIPFVIGMSKVHSFWISPIPADFATTYFFDYFGNNKLLQPFLILLLTYFCWKVFDQDHLQLERITESPLQLTFLVFSLAVLATYLIPYIRSVLVVPMLFNRYTIVALPAFIIALAFSFTMIKNWVALSLALLFFLAATLIDLTLVREFYSSQRIRKTQFRELTKFITEDPKLIYPIVEERTAWQHEYYLRTLGNNALLLPGNKEASIDSILKKTSSKYDLQAFWIVGAHGNEPYLQEPVKQRLDSVYTLIKERAFFDAWAQLYVRSSLSHDITKFFLDRFEFGPDKVVPIWGGSVSSQAFSVEPGKYTLKINHKGTKAGGVFPHVIISLNGAMIGEFDTSENFGENEFPVEITSERDLLMKLDFINDLTLGSEDRNVFVKSIILLKNN